MRIISLLSFYFLLCSTINMVSVVNLFINSSWWSIHLMNLLDYSIYEFLSSVFIPLFIWFLDYSISFISMANPPFSDFATNLSNPYYLHPNENPSLVLVTPSLDNKNYHTWLQSMRVALISKNKLKLVDGTLNPPPVSDLLHEPWLRCNNMVMSWLQRCISETISKSIIWCDRASVVWKQLEKRFAQGDIFRVADILV